MRSAGDPRPGSSVSQKKESTAQANDTPRKAARGLERLEEQIDECLTLARTLDREGLSGVIVMLRRARNEVVWKMGETAER